MSGAFGGLLASALSRINSGGYEGWRWILIIEGLLTIVYVPLLPFPSPKPSADLAFHPL